MIIQDVIIENFFCYLGINDFSFTKGLNVISGRNSSGKSQFFNAFYWTFFEQIYSDENSTKKRWTSAKDLTIYHEKLAQDTSIGEQFSVSVQITLEANDYRTYTSLEDQVITYVFHRAVTYRKNENNIKTVLPSELKIEYVQDGETFIVHRAEHERLLESIFPRSIRKFMWYQGETMDQLYDFSNDTSLKNAINEISYYPKYDFMHKVVTKSDISINKKVEKELNRQNKLSSEQNAIYTTITSLEKRLELKEADREDLRIDIEHLEEEVIKIEQKLSGMDHFVDFKVKLANFEAEEKYVRKQFEDIEINTKEKLINIWMLNGCSELIKASEKNLNIINQEIQAHQQHKNPIPTNLPGPEYVEKMLDDKICYICERPVEKDSDAYEALERRLTDFKLGQQQKQLQENYTDLNRFRKRLENDLPSINADIAQSEKKKQDLIKKRLTLRKQISNIFQDLGFDERADLESNANIAQTNINKMKTYRTDIQVKTKRLAYLDTEMKDIKIDLFEKKALRDSFTKSTNLDIIESQASEYISLFVKTIGKLKDIALKNLIAELEAESNRLYALYLDNREQGKIVFKKGVEVQDVKTKQPLIDLNMGEQVAQKLAVANSFLSLSARKMNRSYPLLADAPSSDLDSFNTYNLTVNIGKSFDQIIIMSKDYVQFSETDLNKLIDKAEITTFYQINNENIESGEDKSRTNRKSVAIKIK